MVFHSPERAATLVVNRWARSALFAAVVPVRPPHRGPAPLRQDRPGLARERHQYTSLMLPGHLNSLPSRCLAVIARRSNPVHGHPLEPPINRGPELQLVPTPPLHSTKTPPSHWKSPEEVSFLNSGRRDPPRDPARLYPHHLCTPPRPRLATGRAPRKSPSSTPAAATRHGIQLDSLPCVHLCLPSLASSSLVHPSF